MAQQTFTRSEVVDLMYRFTSPYLAPDRWNENYRREHESFFREQAERTIQRWEDERRRESHLAASLSELKGARAPHRENDR